MNSNRRGFLKSMLAAAVGSSILLPAFKDAHKWKRNPENFIYTVNPEYITAPYEVRFMHCVGSINTMVLRKITEPEIVTPIGDNLYPPRLDANKNPVLPFVKIRQSDAVSFHERSEKMVRDWSGVHFE